MDYPCIKCSCGEMLIKEKYYGYSVIVKPCEKCITKIKSESFIKGEEQGIKRSSFKLNEKIENLLRHFRENEKSLHILQEKGE